MVLNFTTLKIRFLFPTLSWVKKGEPPLAIDNSNVVRASKGDKTASANPATIKSSRGFTNRRYTRSFRMLSQEKFPAHKEMHSLVKKEERPVGQPFGKHEAIQASPKVLRYSWPTLRDEPVEQPGRRGDR